jgi:hypothetical protein
MRSKSIWHDSALVADFLPQNDIISFKQDLFSFFNGFRAPTTLGRCPILADCL